MASIVAAAAPFLNKGARAKLGRDTINILIPQILNSNERAKQGVQSSELMRYDPSLLPPKETYLQPKPTEPPITSTPRIKVIKSDTFDAAQSVLASRVQGTAMRVAVLNMASSYQPGGGVLKGAVAQEESLCRRSTLYPSLREEFYRLPDHSAIFSPDVMVFRPSNHEAAGDLPKREWFFVDVISCAALKGPDVVVRPDGTRAYEAESSRETMTMKVRLIMQIAAKKGITHLVLGALGCGAYRNPTVEVAQIFRHVLCGGGRRAGVEGIEEVIFAIFDEGENLETFRSVFSDVGSGD